MLQSRFLAPVLALTCLLPLAQTRSSAQTKAAQNHAPVLVELFTAEGCSSCPPADALLERLEVQQPVPGVDIIALGEHVDYWDQLGWRDRFSSPQYTARQRAYGFRLKVDDIYTPQMIVDGNDQFVGNDAAHALHAISRSSQTAKIGLALSKPIVDGYHVATTVSLSTPSTTLPKADLYAALVDPFDTTNVGGGENRGHTLHHVAVVRSLQRIGKLKDLESGPIKAMLTAPATAVPAKMRLIVFAQNSGTGPILGVATIPTTP
jgi:hypothetical protein